MSGQGKVIAVVPARGGSKELPNKNILPLGDKPVLAYTAEAARGASTLDRIILSTDSPEIAQVGKDWGLEAPFMRPAHLATDTAHTPPVIEHAVAFLEKEEGIEVDLVVTLQPTSPLRNSKHIDDAVNLLKDHPEMDCVISVAEADLPPFWLFRLNGDQIRPFVDDGVDYSLKERQEMEQIYRPNGAVYVTRRSLLKDRGIIFSVFAGGKTGYVIMDPISSLDIDTKTDFAAIEAALKETN